MDGKPRPREGMNDLGKVWLERGRVPTPWLLISVPAAASGLLRIPGFVCPLVLAVTSQQLSRGLMA